MSEMALSDGLIIDLYTSRNEKAVEETAKKYGNYCFVISNNIVKNEKDAEECVNDTYLKAWNNIPPEIPKRLGAFLGKIVRNLSLDRYKYNRRAKREGSEFELLLSELEDCISSSATMEEIDEQLTIQLINDWLHSQTSEIRTLFVRRYWYADSVADLSSKFHMSDSKVKSLLFRMRKNLKDYLKKEGVEL